MGGAMITVEECTGQQRAALDRIGVWYRDPGGKQVYRQWGYAGTGKSTLARLAVGQLGLVGTRFAAYTGKAAQVLRSKGCPDVSTIHGLIYQVAERSRARLDELRRRRAGAAPEEVIALDAEIRAEEARLRQPAFELKEESELAGAPLLVLDEASMVDRAVGEDLESFGVRILVLGDPMQLPPVSGAGYFTGHPHDDLLTEIMRSEAGSPVTKIATEVRFAAPEDAWLGVPGAVGDSGRRFSMRREDLLDFDQVVVGRKRTRWQVLAAIRQMRGFPVGVPTAGDRIMALSNSRDAGVFNGEQFTVLDCEDVSDGKGAKWWLQVVDDEGVGRGLRVWASGFSGQAGEEQLTASGAGRGPTAAATFAQAITVHKAQGSQWPRVLVIDEASCFREMARRWMYTAVTRASERVVVASSSAFRAQR